MPEKLGFAIGPSNQKLRLSRTNRNRILPTAEDSRGVRGHITHESFRGYIRLLDSLIPANRENGFTIGRKNGPPNPVIMASHENFWFAVGSINNSNGIITGSESNRISIRGPGDTVKGIVGYGMR